MPCSHKIYAGQSALIILEIAVSEMYETYNEVIYANTPFVTEV